jgi:hypothetical protein
MMRFLIAKSPDIYKELFIYAEDENPSIAKKAKELLMDLPTSSTLQGD